MKFRQLRYVVAVAREGSFTRAARHLNVSQSAISEQVRLLEDELGFAILTRTGQGVEVTSHGRVFLHQSERILSEMQHLRELGRTLSGTAINRLRIGMVSGLYHQLMPTLFSELTKLDDMQYEVHTAPTRVIYDRLTRDLLDLGVTITGDSHMIPPGFAQESLFEVDMQLIFAPGFDLGTDLSPIGIADIAELPWIVSELAVGYGLKVISEFGERGLRPRIKAIADNIETAKVFARSGIGIALVPCGAAQLELTQGLLETREMKETISINVSAVFPRSNPSKQIRTLLDRLNGGKVALDE